MRVVVLGGTGFLGGHVVHALLRRGDDVVVASRDPAAARVPVQVLTCGTSPKDLDGALDGADAVVNLAGAHVSRRWSEADRRLIVESRVETTHALVDALERRPAKSRPRVLVNASACWYGDTGSRSVAEDEPRGDDFFARTCVAWEQAAGRAVPLGVRLVVPRYGMVLGRTGPLGEVAQLFRWLVGGVPGSGEQWVSWIHLDDAVAFTLAALESDEVEGAYNVTSPEPVRMERFCAVAGRVLGRPTWVRVPDSALRLMLGEMADYLVGGVRAEPRRLIDGGFEFRFPTLEPAMDDVFAAA